MSSVGTKPAGRSRAAPAAALFGEPDTSALAELSDSIGWLATAARSVVYGEAVTAPGVAEAVGEARAAMERAGRRGAMQAGERGAQPALNQLPPSPGKIPHHPGTGGTIAEPERRGVEHLCHAVDMIARTIRQIADGATAGDPVTLQYAFLARGALAGFFADIPDTALTEAEKAMRGGRKGTERGR